jgi:hypothetical protein
LSSRGGKLRVERVISRLIPAGQARTSGFILFSRYITGPKPILGSKNPKILSPKSAQPQVMVVLMHKAHYFDWRVTKDLRESSEGARYPPWNARAASRRFAGNAPSMRAGGGATMAHSKRTLKTVFPLPYPLEEGLTPEKAATSKPPVIATFLMKLTICI